MTGGRMSGGGKTGLRVGLTGGLGSGKSTASAMLAEHGARILSADEIGRGLMQPGTDVFYAIVDRFGSSVLLPNGQLNRPALAKLAFSGGRLEELTAIVHPATIARQGQLADEILARDSHAVVVVESALIFETRHGDGWRKRFDELVLVAAPDALKIERFVSRSGAGNAVELRAEARRRLDQLIPDEKKIPECDFVLLNDGSLARLREQVDALWLVLRAAVV